MKTLAVILTSIWTATAWAELEVIDLWARATPPGVSTAAVYATLANHGEQPVVVTGVKTPVAKHAHLHATVVTDGMSRMSQQAELTVQPGHRLAMAPGGLHIMLMGLERELRSGDRFPLTILLSHSSTIETEVIVGNVAQMSAPSHDPHAHSHSGHHD